MVVCFGFFEGGSHFRAPFNVWGIRTGSALARILRTDDFAAPCFLDRSIDHILRKKHHDRLDDLPMRNQRENSKVPRSYHSFLPKGTRTIPVFLYSPQQRVGMLLTPSHKIQVTRDR